MSGKRLTPQQKKTLSYQHDRRNAYGENDKASRKNIPKSKATGERSFRSRVRQLLRSTEPTEAAEAAAAARRVSFGKGTDQPLVEHINRPHQPMPPSIEPSPLQREAIRRARRARRARYGR